MRQVRKSAVPPMRLFGIGRMLTMFHSGWETGAASRAHERLEVDVTTPQLIRVCLISGVIAATCAGCATESFTSTSKLPVPHDAASSTTGIDTAALDAPLPDQKPQSPGITPQMLIGLDESHVVAMVGYPKRTEDRSPAIAWIYSAGNCEVDLLFFPDLASGSGVVLAYQTHDAKGADCVAQLAPAQEAGHAS